MKLNFLLAACVVVLFSCNDVKQDAGGIVQTTQFDSIKKETAVSDSTLNTHLKPLIIARGREPGWYAEFFDDHLFLVSDYGKDTLLLNHDFSGMNSGGSYNSTLSEFFKGKDSTFSRKLIIQLETKPCTESGSGEKRDMSISILYNKKLFKGCASVASSFVYIDSLNTEAERAKKH